MPGDFVQNFHITFIDNLRVFQTLLDKDRQFAGVFRKANIGVHTAVYILHFRGHDGFFGREIIINLERVHPFGQIGPFMGHDTNIEMLNIGFDFCVRDHADEMDIVSLVEAVDIFLFRTAAGNNK